ncbi:hypothetical protein Scep_027749 [Stephania cephalantha]|uniref:Uncharacterized protein n=1 Tax=Stephania cephalantha TaxID=152367 RepID=A0AAP0ED62_9MAGN
MEVLRTNGAGGVDRWRRRAPAGGRLRLCGRTGGIASWRGQRLQGAFDVDGQPRQCRGSSQDFKDSIAIEHPIATVAPFWNVFSGFDSSEPAVPNGFGAVEADLVLPY